jgi:AcrR family transcriptional regulator
MPRPSDPHAKSRLLEAAEKVFCDKGLDHAKVEDITTAAGLSKGAFYLHFASKADAFSELVSRVLAHLGALLDEAECDCGAALDQGLPSFFSYCLAKDVAIYEFLWKNRALVRVVLEGGRSADQLHLIEDFALRAQKQTENFLRVGQKAGLYRQDLEVEGAAAFIAGGYDRLARQLVREKKKPDLHKLLLDVQRLLIRGLGSPIAISTIEQLHTRGAAQSEPPALER